MNSRSLRILGGSNSNTLMTQPKVGGGREGVRINGSHFNDRGSWSSVKVYVRNCIGYYVLTPGRRGTTLLYKSMYAVPGMSNIITL